MKGMYEQCYYFNQPLNKWNVSNVVDMSFMFENCHSFNQDLSNWDVYNVENMVYMFYLCLQLRINPEWIINEKTRTDNMFVFTPLEGLVLEKTKVHNYNVKKANRDVENTIMELSKTNLPGELIEEITTYFDPEMATKSRKTRDKSRKSNKEDVFYPLMPPPKNEMNNPGGGGYAGGRRKRRKRTHKKNKRR
jgi:surface protein